jgi:MYXO-CTERM domain-containing protein
MRNAWLATAVVLLAPALAAGEIRSLKASGAAAYGEFVAGPATIDELRFARQVLPPPPPRPDGTAALAQSRVIYLNKNGVTLQPGVNDARTNRSSIASGQATIPAWSVSATTWSATVSCMRDLFSAYDVTVVESDPGNVPHIEAVFGGSPGLLGMEPNVAGVSPFTTDCSVIENSIVFTFTQVLPPDARLACEIMAQEVAHSFGLDHELLASDPMTYLEYTGDRSFKNETASCGENTARPCGINGSTCRANQNSVALLTERLGKKVGTGDSLPPTGSIMSPSNSATVPPGFSVYAQATDNQGVDSAVLLIDGVEVDRLYGSGPYEFVTPSTLGDGVHRLQVEVADTSSNVVQTQEITVTVKQGAAPVNPPAGAPGSSAEVTGGCSSSGGSSLGGGLGLALAALGLRRRRRS